MRKQFPAARWSTLLKSASIVTSLLLVGAGGVLVWAVPTIGDSHFLSVLVGASLPAVALIALLFVVINYEIDGRQLRVRRLLWHTHIDLAALLEVEADPAASQGSVRTGGNGGLLSFTGYFHSARLGSYEAYVTDWKDAVVVRLRGRTLVVSPADPSAFVTALQAALPEL